MRCNILCYESSHYDIDAIARTLGAEAFSVSYTMVDQEDAIENRLREQTFDLFLIYGDAALLLRVAKLLKKTILPHTLSALFIMPEADPGIKLQLLEEGASYVTVAERDTQAIADLIQLLLQRDRYRSELSSMGGYMRDASLVFDSEADGYRISDVNKAFLDFDGLSQEDLLGELIESTQSVFNLQNFIEDIKEVDETGVPAHMPNYFYDKESGREWCDVYIYKPNSEQVALIASTQTDVKRTHDKAEASRRYLQTILNAQTHIIYITDGDRLINVNRAFLDFFNAQTMHEFVNRHSCVSELFEPSDEAGYINTQSKAWLDEVADEQDSMYKIRIRREGKVTVFIPTVQVVEIEQRRQHVVILTDITELESEKEKLRVIAMTDQLTGAGNRFKFNTVIDEQVAIARRYGTALGIILFDLDGFKQVNDEYGHQTGDLILKELSAMVKAEIRQSDLFIRWGGEEFLILMPNTTTASTQRVAQKLQQHFAKHRFENVGPVTGSFGCTQLMEEDSVSSLVSRADEAMYQAKKAGRNCVKAL